MSKLLILARGDGRNYKHLDGRSILKDLPIDTVVFTDKANAAHFEGLGGNLVLVTKAPIEHVIAFARERGWKHIRLVSAAHSRS